MKRNNTSRTSLLLTGAILVVVNLLGVNWFGRIDLTDDEIYSLSDASIELVENLPDPVTVRAYFSDNVPALATTRRMVRDKLDEYRAYGGINFQYEFISPDSPEDRQTAEQAGIPPLQVQVLEEDGASVRNAYMGMLVEFRDRKETIPVVQDVASLEYEMTVAIRKLSSETLPSVGFLDGYGSPSVYQGLGAINQLLSRIYTVTPVSISEGSLSGSPDVLMVVAPKDTLDVGALTAIDSYIIDGGKVGFLVDQVEVDLQSGSASVSDTGLDRLLDTYGIAINDDLVRDDQSAMITVGAGPFGLPMQMKYPFAPVATRFNEESSITNGLRSIVFPFVSTLDISSAHAGVTVTPLVWSTSQSDVQEGFFMIQPMPNMESPELSGGPFVLAASYEGSFPSAIQSGVMSEPTRLVAVGDGGFIDQGEFEVGDDHLRFVMNAVDWLLQDESLASIRVKNVQPRVLEEVNDGSKVWIKYFNILGPPIFVVLYGLIRWRFKRSRRIILSNQES